MPQPDVYKSADGVPERELPNSISFSDVAAVLDAPYLIKGLVPGNANILLVAESGAAKSFLLTDWLMSVARNIPWAGRRVRGGLPFLVIAEGSHGARNRLAAYRSKFLGADAGPPFEFLESAVNLLDPLECEQLIARVREAESKHGEKCAVIGFDTLNRCMRGADENDSLAMGQAIAGAESIRAATQAAIILVHHLGKDTSRGARGHSSLKAAVDCEITIEVRGTTRVVKATKQRDLEIGAEMAFELESVDLGLDQDGDSVTSCVVKLVDVPVKAKGVPRGKHQQSLLAALREHTRASGGQIISSIDFAAMAKRQGIDRRRLSEARESLERDGWLQPAVGGYRIHGESL